MAEMFPATPGGRHVGWTATSANGISEGIAGPSGLGPGRTVGACVCKRVLEMRTDLETRGSGLYASERSERLWSGIGLRGAVSSDGATETACTESLGELR